MKRPCRRFGRLFFEEYCVSDPFDETLLAASSALHHALHPLWNSTDNGIGAGPQQPAAVTVDREHALRLKAAAEAWLHFGGHPADDETIAKQLTEVRRYARRCRRP
jgi:hypothetical protein